MGHCLSDGRISIYWSDVAEQLSKVGEGSTRKVFLHVYLEIILGIPVRIEDDDSVSSGQINAQAPGPGGQEETELLGPRSWEARIRRSGLSCTL